MALASMTTKSIALPEKVSDEIWQKTQETSVVMQLAQQIDLPGNGLTIPVITGESPANRVTNAIQSIAGRNVSLSACITEAGADAVTVEGMKFKRRAPGTVRVDGDWCYPVERLRSHYEKVWDARHESGLLFLCAENRLRGMGDNMACCCGELGGFRGNDFNAVTLAAGVAAEPTPAMREPGSAMCFKASRQDTLGSARLKLTTFEREIREEAARLLGRQRGPSSEGLFHAGLVYNHLYRRWGRCLPQPRTARPPSTSRPT